ncbi:MAG: ABC transporter substrate-binding protein, partial [Pseudomonadota bacterium]
VARLEAAGAERMLGVSEALTTLGFENAPALVGFVWDRGRSRAREIEAFRAAVTAAADLLSHSDAEWERLRPLMRVAGEAEFTRLRDAYRAGIQTQWSEADTDSARRLHALLEKTGGQRFRDSAGAFDAAVFDQDG